MAAFRLLVVAVFSLQEARAQCTPELVDCPCDEPDFPFVPFDGLCATMLQPVCTNAKAGSFCTSGNFINNGFVCGENTDSFGTSDCICNNAVCIVASTSDNVMACGDPNQPSPSPERPVPDICPPVDDDTLTGDPHMAGLRGQHTEWSGVDGGWYSLIKDDDDESQLRINVRLTAPLAAEFPDRQLVTGMAVISDGHSLVIEVKDPYSVATTGCLDGTTPCLADGALRVTSDGSEYINLLHPMDGAVILSGAIVLSAANLPTECTKFGGDNIWAETFADLQAGHRHLDDGESFEDWVVHSSSLAAPEWCAKYVSERGLAQVQSKFSTFRIQTASVIVRLNVGVNYQGGGERDWDGRLLPDLEFWQMDVGLANIQIGETLTGILGETSRPVLDEEGVEIMEGPRVIRGAVEDYRLSGPLDQSFDMMTAPQNIAPQNIAGGVW